jgi:hypothetical protein
VHALVGSPAARLALAEAGRRWAEEAWHWDATVAAYEMVYEDAIGRVTAHV